MKILDTKKLAAITAAFFITVTAFSGCSESANSSQTTSSVSQAAKSDIDAALRQRTLTLDMTRKAQ